MNIPTIYLMIVEDTGRTALLKDQRRWPAVQAHLMAQAVGSLKMVTIGSGFDLDFDDLQGAQLDDGDVAFWQSEGRKVGLVRYR